MRKIKAFFFKLIRPLFVDNVNPNEDYECVMCREPVLRRYLTCSKKCAEKLDKI